MSESRECYLCHRIGYRSFVQYGDWAWRCFRDDLCRKRQAKRTDRPTGRGGERMTEDANGLSREQVEALVRAVKEGCLGPTVVAMLAEARAEGFRAGRVAGDGDWSALVKAAEREARAEVVRDVEALCDEAEAGHGPMQSKPSGYVPTVLVRRALARHMPAAVRERGTERPGASRGSAGPSESDKPSDGRTGPQAVPFAKVTYKPDESTAAMTGAGIRWQYGWLVAFPDGTYERVHDAYVTEVVHVMRLAV